MKFLQSILLALALGCNGEGCKSENNLYNGAKVYGEPNNIDLEKELVVDEFHSITPDAVDILIAVDDSCSMLNEQSQLAAQWPAFAENLTELNINYRIGFTTISTSQNGSLILLSNKNGGLYYIEPETLNKESLFIYGATPGIGGSGYEAGLEAIKESTKNNDGFYREGSSFYSLIISDEPDQSGYYPFGFLVWLNHFRKTNSVSFVSSGYREQPIYEKIVSFTEGYWMELDDPNWDDFLGNFVDHIEVEPYFNMSLSRYPEDLEDITVLVCDGEFEGDNCIADGKGPGTVFLYKHDKPGWNYEYDYFRNSITLISPERELQSGDDVKAIYFPRDE